MQKLSCPRSGTSGLTFSPDGDMLAGIGRDHLYCWTRSQGWVQTGLRAPGVTSVAFHPDGRLLAYSGTHSREIQIVNEVRLYSLTPECRIEPEQLQFEPGGEPNTVFRLRQVAFSPDGLMLVANRTESRSLFYSPATLIEHWSLVPVEGGWRVTGPVRAPAPNGAALVADSALVLVGTWGTQVCPLDPTATAPLAVPDVSRAQFVVAAPRGELVAIADERRIRVWYLRASAPLATWRIASRHPFPPPARAFAPDGRTLAIGTDEGTVTFFDPLTGRSGAAFDFGVGSVQSLTYAPDGLTLAVAGRTGLVVVDVE